MFKNLFIFKINAGWDITHEQAIEAVETHRFQPTLPTQDKSFGWVEPRGEDHAQLVESVDGQLILKLMVETRAVPGGAVRKKAKEEADRIEAETGRKPGKKETAIFGSHIDVELTALLSFVDHLHEEAIAGGNFAPVIG